MEGRTEFYVHQSDFSYYNNDDSPKDQMRLEEAWGPKKRRPDDFMRARNGDHLIAPFECDLCVFRKLKHRDPSSSSEVDKLLLDSIRRVMLDSFWSRASSTVNGNALKTRLQIEMSELVGLEDPFDQLGTLPLHNHCGYEAAVGMVIYSRRPGRYAKDHLQFDTVRQFRSTYSNFIRASALANKRTLALGDFDGNYHRLVEDPCGSLWFKKFMEGLRFRMGQLWRPNKALSTVLIKLILEYAQNRIDDQSDTIETHRWTIFAAFVVITYVASLRGAEGFLFDLRGTWEHLKKSNQSYVVIALLGRVKGEHFHRAHLLSCVNVTSSGIKVRETLENLLNLKKSLGFSDGPGISDIKGKLFRARDIDDMLIEALIHHFKESQDLFSADIKTEENIEGNYQCFRTFRRSATTRALEKKVSKNDIEIVNRWRSIETSKGRKPYMNMHLHYAQIGELLNPFLRFTEAM